MQKIINISDIIYYGRHYTDCPILEDYLRWYAIDDGVIYTTREIIEKFQYSNLSEIQHSNRFILLFQVDIIELEKIYIDQLSIEAVKIYFHKVKHEKYDLNFKIFLEKLRLERDWFQFERNALIKVAIEWCKENHLPYKL